MSIFGTYSRAMAGRYELLHGMPRLQAEGRERLSTLGWLSRMPQDFREALLAEAIFRRAEPGTEFMHAGDTAGGLVAVAVGSVEVAFLEGHPDTRAIHLAHAGFWAGYRTLLGYARYLSLSARNEVIWALVPQRAVMRILAEHPDWWKCIAQLSAEMSMLANIALGDLSRQDSEARVVSVLLRLSGCRNGEPPEDSNTEVRLSQSELASMAVMSRNTCNCIVGRLVKEGLVELSYRSIKVLKPAQLLAIVDYGS